MKSTCSLRCIQKHTFHRGDSISLHCWGSPSFIKNNTRSLSHFGTSLGNASLNTHLKLNLCWLGMNIHIHTICVPIERREEKVRRWYPLLFEWEVTSTQITSGHTLNNQNAGFTIQANAMNSASSFCRYRSDLSSIICAEREMIAELSFMGSYYTWPVNAFVVDIVIVSTLQSVVVTSK